MDAALHVEHIRHKDSNPELEREWTNFLLACPSCNSSKGTKVDSQADVDSRLWPHLHRTFAAFVYEEGGRVRVADLADPQLREQAQSTAMMVELFRRPGYRMTRAQDNAGSDRRWLERLSVWDQAVESRADLRRCDTPEMRRQVLKTACASGFWSVWMTVFADDPGMRAALCEAFPGTARARV